METVNTLAELQMVRSRLHEPVGLIPTMGYLHEGHLSLVRQAQLTCKSVVVTIFVNPTQFGPGEDLDSYPRDIPRDLMLLENTGCDLVWLPDTQSMYPPGFQTWVSVEKITQYLEGEQRPGHFRGVTTVVSKLFNAVRPQQAFFGQKDAQQARVIQRMACDLNYPVEIVICPIIREADGLAMSSRNNYLSPDQRIAATVLYHTLMAAKQGYEAGERDAHRLRSIMKAKVKQEPLARLQYASVADPQTLKELDMVGTQALFSLAVFMSKTRLIDNFLLLDGTWHTGIQS